MTDSPAVPAGRERLARFGWAAAVAVLALDQASKWAVLEAFTPGPRVIEVLPVFNLVLAWNRGISFGMFHGAGAWGPWVLVVLAIVIAGFLARWLRNAENLRVALSLGAIIGGAVGNVIDRLRFEAVVDFLDVHVLGYHWPAFNVADSAITIGAALLIWDSLFGGHEKS